MEERVGFGAYKLELKPGATRDERIRRSRDMLSRVLNLGTTVAFVGAGCSIPLGYPSWKTLAKLLAACATETLQASALPSKSADMNMLGRLQQQLMSDDIRPHQIMFILGECKRIFERCQAMKKYYRFLHRTFRPRPHPTGAINPYDRLLGLPIKRFITTNYDREIESALERNRELPESNFILHRRHREDQPAEHVDFTQEHVYHDKLALFALARVTEAENMIFHCHGHYNHPESLVVTEADYQRWYLAQEKIGTGAFNQTISLLFGSNPILFVGYGLGDDDLLGTLRMFNATEPHRKSSRPLFALFPERNEGEDDDDHRFYYERYGVNVIPFLSPNDQDRGPALCRAVDAIKESWNHWRSAWLQKPMIRRIKIDPKPPDPYHHYPTVSRGYPAFGGDRVQNLLEDLRQKAEAGTQLIALVGPGGTGKSWHAQQLMELMYSKETRFKGFFFWSSYYADDSLTGLDRALCYLGRDTGDGSRIQRFEESLQDPKRPCFLVFDGIERFLDETENPEEGAPFESNTSSFLAAMARKENASTVLLTSRLWPNIYNLPEFEDSRVHRMRIPLFVTADIETVPPFNWIEHKRDLSALCSLLEGHIYGLVLAARMISRAGKAGAEECLKKIKRSLSDTSPHGRTSKMIHESIVSIDDEWNGLALKLLERLAVFMRPVTSSTLDICYESAVEQHGRGDSRGVGSLIETLLATNLVHKVRASPNRDAYTVHPIVRGYVYQRIHHATTDAIPNFTLPGFTAGTATVDPGDSKEAAAVVTDIFGRLHAASEKAAANDNENQDAAQRLCRAAFGVVRSRMESNTSPRWTTYDDYLRILIKTGNLAKKISPNVWDYAERHDLSSVEDVDGPLYADELAWLYNEIGLARYSEGTMQDAYGVWEQGHEINRVIDSFEEGGRYLFQSLCNLGAVYVHLGNLSTAERYLRQAEHVNFQLKDEDHAGRVIGYLGVVQHLRGNLQQADDKYAVALGKIEDARNPRAQSIFLRHRTDLKIQQGDLTMAGALIQMSRSLAEAERYPELIAYSRLSLGHLHRSQKDYEKALREYNFALNTGRRIGMRRLEAETLTELSRLAYDLGDAEIARHRATESLRIANDLVLGLRQTHDLVVLGLATIQTGQRDLGIAYLRHAKRIAERQEYRLRSYEAEEHLQRYGGDVSSGGTG